MSDPLSPALNAPAVKPMAAALPPSSQPPKPASKKDASKGKSSETKAKNTGPVQGDTFAASIGYGGKDCVALANVADIPVDAEGSEEAVEAAKTMKNLLYAPTHKSYEKNVHTNGHVPSAEELECTAYLMPAILRDNTKFARPIVPIVCRARNGEVSLTYVVYGNEAKTGGDKLILYNLDAMHGVALSTNVRRFKAAKGLWCSPNLVDHQVRYVLAMLHKIPGMKICVDYDWKYVYGCILSSRKLTTRLLVVDGLSAATCQTLRGAYMVELLPEELGYVEEDNIAPSVLRLSVAAFEQFSSMCNDTYVHDEWLFPLADLAARNIKDRIPRSLSTAPEPDGSAGAKESDKQGTKKRPATDSDSDAAPLLPPLPPPPKKSKSDPPLEKRKKKRDDDDDEEDENEMSDSGSDSGSESDSDDDSDEEEQDDSEEESADDDSDDDKPQKSITKPPPAAAAVPAALPPPPAASPKAASLLPAVASNDPFATAASPAAVASPQPATGVLILKPADVGEKEKRKPAKSRRQSMEKMITGILRHGLHLDDAMPAKNYDTLVSRISNVEHALQPFVEEGRVEHVKPLLETSWGLIRELFAIINIIGRAGGPVAPDAAASRKLALSMGRLFDAESNDMEGLLRELTAWQSKMTALVANRAQVAMQAEQDARQLASGAGSSGA